MVRGVDTVYPCEDHHAIALKQAGYEFVGRYYKPRDSKYETLTVEEAKLLSNAGLKIVALWEFMNKPSYFNRDRGRADGSEVCSQAASLGQPENTPIYFGVDTDLDDAHLEISEYFEGIIEAVKQVSGGRLRYQVGVYGSGLICSTLQQRKLVAFTWLAGISRRWRGADFSGWNIKQIKPDIIGGLKVDIDEAQEGYAGFNV
jgi:hypothetical protein